MELTNVTTTSGILEPGLRKYMPYGMERYQVPAIYNLVASQVPWNRNFFQKVHSARHAFAVLHGHQGFDVSSAIFQSVFAVLNVGSFEYSWFFHNAP